jgi:hypothetical protein
MDNRELEKSNLTHSRLIALVALFTFVFVVASMPIYNGCESRLAGQNGLVGKYYRNPKWEGEPAETQVDQTVDFDWSKSAPLPAPFSVEWRGSIFIQQPGDYTFTLISDDGSLLEIDDRVVVDATKVLLERKSATINLSAGQHEIRVRYFNLILGGSIRLFWAPPGKPEQILPTEQLRPISN